MQIEITQRLNPFCLEEGTWLPLPLTSYAARLFSGVITLAPLDNLDQPFLELLLQHTGCKQFMAMLNLEKQRLEVGFLAKEGWIRYTITAQPEGIYLFFANLPTQGINIYLHGEKRTIRHKSEPIVLEQKKYPLAPIGFPRIALGCHKKSYYPAIKARADLREILPLWHQLAHSMPSLADDSGTGFLFDQLAQYESNCNELSAKALYDQLLLFWQLSFHQLLLPTTYDHSFQNGLEPSQRKCQGAALSLLQRSAKALRKLFLDSQDETLILLSQASRLFASGQLTEVAWHSSQIAIAWSKFFPRALLVKTPDLGAAPRTLSLRFPKEVRQCRIRYYPQDRGQKLLLHEGSLLLPLESEKIMVDRFEN